MLPRVDIFSAKGGVGKTTLSLWLADAQAQKAGAPVLLVDADLTGTCIGDLLQPGLTERWHSQPNLVHLVCGIPERLDDELRHGGKSFPVYEYDAAVAASTEAIHVRQNLTDPKVLFCPSHSASKRDLPGKAGGKRPIPQAVLHALLGHESAGGWVNQVITQLVAATKERVPALAAVIVDHGPGFGALQRATLDAIAREADTCWQALVVTTRDYVDLAAVGDFEAPLDPGLRDRIVWAVNRVPRSVEGPQWKDLLTRDLRADIQPVADWFRTRSFPVYHDDRLAEAYARSSLIAVAESMRQAVDSIRAQLFGR